MQPLQKVLKLEGGPLLGAVRCRVQGTEGRKGVSESTYVLGTLKLPAGQDAIGVRLLGHSPLTTNL